MIGWKAAEEGGGGGLAVVEVLMDGMNTKAKNVNEAKSNGKGEGEGGDAETGILGSSIGRRWAMDSRSVGQPSH